MARQPSSSAVPPLVTAPPEPPRPNRLRGWLTLFVVALLLAGLVLLGRLLPSERPGAPGAQAAAQGRTGSVCAVGATPGSSATPGQSPSPGSTGAATPGAPSSGAPTPPNPTDPATPTTPATPTASSTDSATPASPSGSASDADSGPRITIAAVAARLDPGATGSLTGRALGGSSGAPPLDITTQGRGQWLTRQTSSLVLDADGVMSTSSAGAVYSQADDGQDRGLQLAPCAVPSVNQWLTGLGARSDLRSELLLSNPDNSEAEVDLRFYGRNGPVTAPGASSLTIPALSTRAVSLEDLLSQPGPVAVNVRASVGRVAAVSHDLRSSGDDPAGAELHPTSAAPQTRQVIAAVPGGKGDRELSVVNPGERRTTVRLEVLGPEGAFVPAGAATLDVPAQSTGSIDVSAGLAGQIGTIRLTSDQPVTGSVTATSQRSGAADDLAVQTAQPAVGRVALAPVAVPADVTSELALSNSGRDLVTVSIELLNLDGVSLYTEDIPIGPNSTVARRLTQPAPAYLVLRTPNGADVHGGSTLSSEQESVAGIAGSPLITPDLAGRAKPVTSDPRVAR